MLPRLLSIVCPQSRSPTARLSTPCSLPAACLVWLWSQLAFWIVQPFMTDDTDREGTQ